jgi:hypothetical protein
VTNCVLKGKTFYIVAALFGEFAFKSSLAVLQCFDMIWCHLHCLKYRHFSNTKHIIGAQNTLNTSSQPVSAVIKLQRKLVACSGIAQSLYEYFSLVVCTFGSVATVCEAVELIGWNVTSDITNKILIALARHRSVSHLC